MRLLINELKPRVVALDLSGVPDLEYPALKMLSEAERRQGERGLTLWLVGFNPGVLQMVQRSPLGMAVGREKMQYSLERAESNSDVIYQCWCDLMECSEEAINRRRRKQAKSEEIRELAWSLLGCSFGCPPVSPGRLGEIPLAMFECEENRLSPGIAPFVEVGTCS